MSGCAEFDVSQDRYMMTRHSLGKNSCSAVQASLFHVVEFMYASLCIVTSISQPLLAGESR